MKIKKTVARVISQDKVSKTQKPPTKGVILPPATNQPALKFNRNTNSMYVGTLIGGI